MNWLIPGGMVDLTQGYDDVCPNVALNLPNKVDPSDVDHGSAFGNGSSGGSSSSNNLGAVNAYKNPDSSGPLYTNSKNHLTFNIYEQCNYSAWNNLCSAGCNVIAAASALSAIDPYITPATLSKAAGSNFLDAYVNNKKVLPNGSEKLNCGRISTWEEIKRDLWAGNVVVAKTARGTATVRTGKDHFVAFLDIRTTNEGDEVYIGNSYKNWESHVEIFRSGWQSLEKVTKTHGYLYKNGTVSCSVNK